MTMGTRMAKVPQLVPVENARNTAIANMIAGTMMLAEAPVPTMVFTNAPISRASPMPFNVQAKIRIAIAGIISLKPSTKLSMNPLKVTTPRGRYRTSMKRTVIIVAKIRLVSASQPANAVMISVAPPRKPV